MKQFRNFIRFLVALTILVPYWFLCSILYRFIDWLTDDAHIAKTISGEHLNWLLWRT